MNTPIGLLPVKDELTVSENAHILIYLLDSVDCKLKVRLLHSFNLEAGNRAALQSQPQTDKVELSADHDVRLFYFLQCSGSLLHELSYTDLWLIRLLDV